MTITTDNSIELINKDTIIDALVNRCDVLFKITQEQSKKIEERNRLIKELLNLVEESTGDKIFKSKATKQK
jgi:hypothetical protein